MTAGEADAALTIEILVHGSPELDPEDQARLTRGLRTELDELDVDSVELARDAATPAGAKGDPVTIGALIVALSAAGGVFPSLIGMIREWLDRQSGGQRVSVTVNGDTIELERASAEQQADLVDAFVRRHIKG